MSPHPGKTAAQRRALDAIGCGNFSPRMLDQVRAAMLKAGLIQPAGVKVYGTGPLAVYVQEYEMPIPVHMAWCKAMADQHADEADEGRTVTGQ